MKNILILILATILLTSCNNSQTKTVEKNERFELVPEPDKHDRLLGEATQKLKKLICDFSEPDTSLCGMELRNYESADRVIGVDNITDEREQYHFYTKHSREIITMTQHAGDVKNQISVFKVSFSGKADYGYKELNIDSTKTEKGIKLNMTKKDVVSKLGNCYAVVDSGKNYIEILYRIEYPKDSKTKFLEKNNMPIYYATYGFSSDILKNYEFGFEYP